MIKRPKRRTTSAAAASIIIIIIIIVVACEGVGGTKEPKVLEPTASCVPWTIPLPLDTPKEKGSGSAGDDPTERKERKRRQLTSTEKGTSVRAKDPHREKRRSASARRAAATAATRTS
jgi:hypothetical protein